MFDRAWLAAPLWTPLSALDPMARPVVEGLWDIGSCMYVLTNAYYGSTVGDPGVGGFLWAMSRDAALRYYDFNNDWDIGEPGCSSPPQDLVGFAPLTYGEAIRYAKSSGDRPQVAATYRFTDGRFVCTQVSWAAVVLVFASLNPPDDEMAFAVQLNLLPEHGPASGST